MKKFIFVIIVLAAVGYYFKADILAKKNEMKLKSFTDMEKKFWKNNRKFSQKKKLEKTFDKIEEGILEGKIDSIEYEDLVRFINRISKDQKITSPEVKNLQANVDKWISGVQPMIRD